MIVCRLLILQEETKRPKVLTMTQMFSKSQCFRIITLPGILTKTAVFKFKKHFSVRGSAVVLKAFLWPIVSSKS